MVKKPKLLKTQLKDLIWFGRQIFRQWFFWLFLILDFVALVVQFFSPEFRLPQFVYIGLALIGFFWAGFKVNQELLTKYNTLIKDNPALVIEPVTKASINLIEGNEYNFSIGEPYKESAAFSVIHGVETNEINGKYDENGLLHIDGGVFYVLPSSNLFINLRIKNDGNIPFDVLAINSDIPLKSSYPFLIYRSTVLNRDNTMTYPHHFQPGDLLLIKIRYSVASHPNLSDAQFAASLREIKNEINNSISVDILDREGKRQVFEKKLNLSITSLVDLYIAQWQQFKQSNLLRLAGNGVY